VAGFDAQDAYSRREPAQTRVFAAAAASNVRVGVPASAQLRALAPEDLSRFHEALERVRGIGGVLVEVDVTALLKAAHLLYSGPWVAERTAILEHLLASNPTAIHPV